MTTCACVAHVARVDVVVLTHFRSSPPPPQHHHHQTPNTLDITSYHPTYTHHRSLRCGSCWSAFEVW